MKKITIISTIMICLISCQFGHLLNKDKCTEYNDSLTIHTGDENIKVSLTNLSQSSRIQPYSMIYDNRLVVLNKNGFFYAFDLECLARDIHFEEGINELKFKRAFVVSDKLFGVDTINHAFILDNKNNKWTKYQGKLPLDNSNPIYENEKYICYSTNHGEFGGILFFYNKKNNKITYMPASRVVSMIEYQKGFYITTNSTHMMDISSIIKLENPDSLDVLPDSLNMNFKWDKMVYYYPIIAKSLNYPKQIKNIYNVNESLIFSGFNIGNRNYFLTQHDSNNNTKICLTILDKGTLRVIPTSKAILNNILFTRGDRTRKYNQITLIDCADNAENSREWEDRYDRNLLTTTFIVRDSTVVRINWTKE